MDKAITLIISSTLAMVLKETMQNTTRKWEMEIGKLKYGRDSIIYLWDPVI